MGIVNLPSLRVLKDEGFCEAFGEGSLEFRLTYQGPLVSDNKGSKMAGRAEQKQEIRKHFHKQLARLWQTAYHLKTLSASGWIDQLGENFRLDEYRFVPLVTTNLHLYCSLEILFLRGGAPSAYQDGDIDNRIKTLIDGLKRPNQMNHLGQKWQKPESGETPFFVLLEDDSMITKLSVETDTLLEPVGDDDNGSDARVVIKVTLRPYIMTVASMEFL